MWLSKEYNLVPPTPNFIYSQFVNMHCCDVFFYLIFSVIIGCEANEEAILDFLFRNKHYTKKAGLSPAPKSKPISGGGASGTSAAQQASQEGFASFASSSSDFSALSGARSDPNAFKKTEGMCAVLLLHSEGSEE